MLCYTHVFLVKKNGIRRPESKMKYILTFVIDCGCSPPNINLHDTYHYSKERLQTQHTFQGNSSVFLQIIRIIINGMNRYKIGKICNCPHKCHTCYCWALKHTVVFKYWWLLFANLYMMELNILFNDTVNF